MKNQKKNTLLAENDRKCLFWQFFTKKMSDFLNFLKIQHRTRKYHAIGSFGCQIRT